ncbi:sterol desaturase family protein [Pelagibius sp. Alg239-R121]|uniref:sterol desaturase family protein n=1 Tax=Pelagibius sp. Alg239-R121 TaxID=2993448 RepID=UPI0024A6C44B|nr:sterol desaturase family protein [Pelagibius sp. Alg239-R121]
MDNLESRFDAYAGPLEILGYYGLAMIALTLIEILWDLAFKQRSGWKETVANITIAAVNSLLERTAYGAVFIIALFLAESFVPYQLPVNLWTWFAALVLADFTYYWMHRFEHEIRVLWAYHSVHHSSPEYNLTTAFRLAWIEGLVEWVFFIPMILLGFNLVQTVMAIFIVVAYQTWIHTQKIGRLGWLDKVFNTPSVHRVHHGSNEAYLDKNYGGVLIVWDRMFGTYQAETEDTVFGITKPLKSSNPITINFHEFQAVARDCWNAKSPGNAWRYLVKRPGWEPPKTAG